MKKQQNAQHALMKNRNHYKERSFELRERVFIEKCDSYDNAEPVVHKLLDKCYQWPFLPVKLMIPQNFEDVLIKPNWMMRSPDSRCVTTNKKIVGCIQSWVRKKQDEYKTVLKYGGMKTSDKFEIFKPLYDGRLKGHINIAQDALGASLVINAPKLKSHYLMKITCAVKNMFGCVDDRMKWHYKTNLDDFAYLIARACQHITPQIVLVDAIDVLEGFGPGPRGTPKHLGYLIAGTNPFEVDAVILNMLGVSKEDSPVHKNMGHFSFKVGSDSEVLPLFGNWKMDLPSGDAEFYLEANNKCNYCQICSNNCPAEAIVPADLYATTGPVFTNKCVRCCVCLEFCPEGAIDVKVHRRLI